MSNVIKLTSVKSANGGAVKPLYTKTDPKLIKIEKQYKLFQKTLKAARKSGASIDVSELRWMRKTVRMLIPIAAEVFATYKNDRAAVSLNILMNQQREILNDIRALDAGPRQLNHISERIIQPMLQSVMQNYMVQNADLKRQIRKIKDSKLKKLLIKQLANSLESQGQFFNMLQQGLETKLQEYLVGKSK